MSIRASLLPIILASLTQIHVAPAQEASRLSESVAAIAAGQDDAARRQAIVSSLEAAGVSYQLEDFTSPKSAQGTNIVATLPQPNAAKTILLGAHYDRVALGQGAVDNAGSCAVLLSLARALKATPLHHYSVTLVFFDLEEGGLFGSQAYFAKHVSPERLPDEAVNLDIFAYGDTLFGIPTADNRPLAKALAEAGKQTSVQIRILAAGSNYPSSDHQNMAKAGIDSMGLALVGHEEPDLILSESAPPHTLTIIHSARDIPSEIRAEEMDRGRAALEKMLRILDDSQAPRGK